MTTRKHSIQKRRNKMTDILLRTVAIVHHSALGYGEVRTVDMKLERVSLLDRYQAGAIAQWAHPWCILMAVMTDDKRMHTAVVNLSSPMVQADLTPTLEEEHHRLLAKVKIEIGLEGNGVQVHSFGWIAMPRQQDIEDEKAERLFAAALRTMRRAAA